MKNVAPGIFFVLCGLCHAASPEVEISLGKPEASKDVEGLLDCPAKITNKSAKTIWFYSVAGDSSWLHYSAYTRASAAEKWEELPYGMCGVGATLIELKPNASVSFGGVAPSDDAGYQYRISIAVLPSLHDDVKTVEVFSNTVTIPKMSDKQALANPLPHRIRK